VAAVGLTAQYLHPSMWGAMLHASIGTMDGAAFWAAVLQIVFINILLSGDNAVVIAMACRNLPAREKLWGIVLGAGVAVILRLVFTGVVGELMLLPYLKLAGGLALIYVAAKLVVPERADKNGIQAVSHLWRAVRIVVVADIVMSLDNVIAVAAVAQGSLLLLAIGLAASIPIILAGAAIVMLLIDRFQILIWAGAGLLGWIAGEVIATDPAILNYVVARYGVEFSKQVEFAAAISGILLTIAIGGLWRQFHLSRARGERARVLAEHA
jgi:YjbE family integral membrane protein